MSAGEGRKGRRRASAGETDGRRIAQLLSGSTVSGGTKNSPHRRLYPLTTVATLSL